MQTQSGIPARFANCFLEGISTPQRFAEGLRLLAEALNCEQASVKFWDKRGGWASLRKARHIDAGWQLIAEDLAQLDPDERAELVRLLASTTPDVGSETDTATPDVGAGAVGPQRMHPGRLAIARARIRADMIARGVRRGTA